MYLVRIAFKKLNNRYMITYAIKENEQIWLASGEWIMMRSYRLEMCTPYIPH